jgi:mono/diheme cytochrome c family protein
MTPTLKWTGFLATLLILFIIPAYTWFEPAQQAELLQAFQTDAVVTATDLYAENCAVCHGAAGEGIGTNPALNTDAIREMSATDLFKTIARGRNDTLMAAWAVDEGGVLSNAQIESMITFVQEVNWAYVAVRVDELGLTPPPVIEMAITEEMLTALATLPDSPALSAGLTVYAENCAACHGGNAAGTVIAPALDTADLRATPQADLLALVNEGVPGTLMAAWQGMLTPEELTSVVELLYQWPNLMQAGVAFPEVEMTFATTPEMIEAGARLYNIACKTCHGVDAYGSPMAPALNNLTFLADTPDAAIYQIIAGGVSGTMMPAWGSRLNDQELQALVAYLRSLEPEAPVVMPPILAP